jgi:hypothetical protein
MDTSGRVFQSEVLVVPVLQASLGLKDARQAACRERTKCAGGLRGSYPYGRPEQVKDMPRVHKLVSCPIIIVMNGLINSVGTARYI